MFWPLEEKPRIEAATNLGSTGSPVQGGIATCPAELDFCFSATPALACLCTTCIAVEWVREQHSLPVREVVWQSATISRVGVSYRSRGQRMPKFTDTIRRVVQLYVANGKMRVSRQRVAGRISQAHPLATCKSEEWFGVVIGIFQFVCRKIGRTKELATANTGSFPPIDHGY